MQATMTETAITQAHPLTQPVYPRFTPQEAMILNIVVGEFPRPIEEDELLRRLSKILPPTRWGTRTRNGLRISICMIRAKLGERKQHPSRLMSVYTLNPNGSRGMLAGYVWRG